MSLLALMVIEPENVPLVYYPEKLEPEYYQKKISSFLENETLYRTFLETLEKQNVVLNREIILNREQQIPDYFISGLKINHLFIIIISECLESPESMKMDLIRISTEQTNIIREAYKKLSELSPGQLKSESWFLEEVTRVNNELANAQRELAQKKAELERLYQLEKELSSRDSLTGVLNRRGLRQFAHRELLRAQRTGNPFSLALADIDFFKNINDRYGHAAGDEVLKTIADIIKSNLRETDLVARWGGEEFLILLTDTTVDRAAGILERLRTKIEKTSFSFLESGKSLTVSFGLTVFMPGKSLETLIEEADAALYEAKRTGRNRVVPWKQEY